MQRYEKKLENEIVLSKFCKIPFLGVSLKMFHLFLDIDN